MKDINLERINILINGYEDQFQKALTSSEGAGILNNLKKNLQYLREIKAKANAERHGYKIAS